MDRLYLDNNATTQPHPQVVDAVAEMLRTLWANPSSVHRFGQAARQRIELARASVAQLIGCRDRELVFTSGGTEASNLALRGVLGKRQGPRAKGPGILFTTAIEHSSVRDLADELANFDVQVVNVPVDSDGRIDPDTFADVLREHAVEGTRPLVSIQWANNETGVIEPIGELVQRCRDHQQQHGVKVLFHCDAVQAVGKVPVDVKAAGVDLLTLSAHKFHGPKGAGALFVRSGVRLAVQQFGGAQERERRGGTENTAGIVAMGVAADMAHTFVQQDKTIAGLQAMRDRLEAALVEALPHTVVNGPPGGAAARLWNTSNLGFERLEAEAILLGLSEKGLCASAGAACSSGSLEPSPVLLAMGVPEPVAHGSIRFSISRFTTDSEIDKALHIITQVVTKLRQTLPMGV